MVHLLQAKYTFNIVFGFTALDSLENAFFLRNQGKGVFLFLPIFFINCLCHQDAKPQCYKEKSWGGGVYASNGDRFGFS